MKNKLKLLAIAVSVLATSNTFAADEATSAFTWAGTVPAATSTGDIQIVDTGVIPFDSGTLLFKESATPGSYDLTDSTEMQFQVQYKGTGTAPTAAKYEITNVKYSVGGGLMNEVDETTPEFKVVANGVQLDKNSEQNVDLEKDVKVMLATPNALSLTSGDEVVVQAAILVTGV